jgi:ABC-type lipoprotein export system ATPase subunit
MNTFIKTNGLKKIYCVGDQVVEALKGVDLEIAQGDFAVFMGHSGSGKTTLVSTIGGLTRPSEGTVLIEGNDIWKLDDRRLSNFRNRKIGFMFQSFSLLPTLNVLNNVVMPSIFSNGSDRKDTEALRSKAISLLADLDMKRKVASFPSELSGGEQRRVAIARALINDPEIILADEPTGELDIRTEKEVIDIFCHINNVYRKTLIVVSHSLTWLEKAKTIIVMKDGLMFKDLADPVEAIMDGVCRK